MEKVSVCKAALGAKPGCPKLKRALEFGSEADFFQFLPDEAFSASAETVSEFMQQNQARGFDARRGVHVVFLGGSPAERVFLVSALKAFLAPVPVSVEQKQSLDESRLSFFRHRASPSMLDSSQLIACLERDSSPLAGLTMVVSFRPCSASEHASLRDGSTVGVVDISREHRTHHKVCTTALRWWSRMAPCKLFQCAMSEPQASRGVMALCPVCLRKFSLCTGCDIVERYVNMLGFNSAHGMREDAEWFASRLAYLGEYQAVQEYELERRPEREESGEEKEVEKERMQASLATLKARMRRSSGGPVFG